MLMFIFLFFGVIFFIMSIFLHFFKKICFFTDKELFGTPKYFLHLVPLLKGPILIRSKWNDETDLRMHIISFHYN